MPSFNHAIYLREAIDSVLSQGYPGLEFLLLDGGSTDGSLNIINEYRGRLDHVRSHSDEGQTAALIEGFSRATGDLIGWLNSDDVIFPGSLWQIAKAYEKMPDAALIGGNFVFLD